MNTLEFRITSLNFITKSLNQLKLIFYGWNFVSTILGWNFVSTILGWNFVWMEFCIYYFRCYKIFKIIKNSLTRTTY